MLRDYIIMYSDALKEQDENKIRKIEKELKRLGIDVQTALVLVEEYRKGKL